MSSILTGLVGNAAGLYSALTGAPQLVQFLDAYGNTLIQFDASLSETYTTTAEPTQFPVEDGSSISDHITRTPLELQISAMVTDTPLGGVQQLMTEAATVAATAALPPLGVIAAATGLAIWQAHQLSDKPSLAAYATLLSLQNGNPDATPPTPPQPFSVKTRLGTYDSMVIKSLAVPRDAETGSALIFNMTLQQLIIVASQTLSVSQADVPGLAAARQTLGDQQGQNVSGFRPGYEAAGQVLGK